MCRICSGGVARRGLMGGALAAGLAAALPALAQPDSEPSPTTPEAALQRLREGNARYAANMPRQRDFSARRAALAAGQSPFAAVLGCADSRVAPELAFDQDPGDIFVVRVAGNFVTREGLGSLEYGARVLGTKVILVLGHTRCGAVDATLASLRQPQALPGHVGELVEAMKPGIAAAPPGDAVAANVRHNVMRLLQSGPVLPEMVAAGELRIAGGVYDLATGQVTFL
ncbi:carbonic anhydrase [Pseudoroseomonas cervicalis]|uniref:carbonic anhydrase n=1 Tax=Teichococcus cervicalis TaxID=204525 RepID=UPI0022F1595F|nr:carbonic anhydrase [Pseudoroseomonas cervicalis]WBV45156.1 carbonic anhydrase [Pseudoroseomonas cervicalis]